MHEFALAQALVEQVRDLAAPSGRPVLEVELSVGELTAVNEEALRFAFQVLRDDEPSLGSCELICRFVPIEVRCPCGAVGQPPDPLLLVCPVCGERNVELTSGRQIDIVRVSVADDEPAQPQSTNSDTTGTCDEPPKESTCTTS